MYAKELRNKLPRLAADMQAIVDRAKKDGDRGLTSEEREQFHKLEADYTAIEDSIKIAEKSANLMEGLKGADDKVVVEALMDTYQRKGKQDDSPYAKAFSNYLRQGERASGEDRKILNTMSTTTGSQGGYVVPTGFSDKIDIAEKWFGGIEGTVTKLQTSTGNPLNYPTMNDTSNKGRFIGQNVQVTETDIAFGQVTFNAYIASSDLVLIPLALIEDSYFDLEGLVTSRLGERLGRLKNNACTVGTGSSQPTGIVTAAVAAGNVTTLATGNTTSISYSNLIDLEHSVDASYRFKPSTYWMFSDSVLKTLKKLVDGQNRPLWQPGLSASFREGAGVDMDSIKPTILDHPYIVNNDMAAPGANAYTMLFGDMSKFVVREVAGGKSVLVLRERYADYLQCGVVAYERYDSLLIDAGTHPVAVLQQSAT